MIPDDVIEAMATAAELAYRVGGNANAMMRAALPAAEAKGWKLAPREPNKAMMGNSEDDEHIIWRCFWDAAPSAKDAT